jgi:hypothetical protein
VSTPQPQPQTRRARREAERRRKKAVTVRLARQGDAGNLFVPEGTVVVIEELSKGIRVKRFVMPDGWE